MKSIIAHQKEWVSAWVAQQIGCSPIWGDHQAIGLEQDGKIIAGVVIDSYKKHTRCSIHCAGIGKNWLNREFLRVVFDYVFRQLKCKAVVNTVNLDNADSIRFTKHLGFEETAVIPDAELMILTMPRNKCRWLNMKEHANAL